MHRNPARIVLIVEPDADARSALRSTLERDGYIVVATAGAVDALSVVDSPGISLVITELYLGSGGDPCLLRTMRRSLRHTRTNMLAYTRHSRGEDRAWAVAEGANGYVLKKNGEARLLEVTGRLSSPRARGKRRVPRGPVTE
jgi:CheY-like chemotaxis protein